MLDLECLAGAGSGKGRRIEDDRVEKFAFARQPRQNGQDVISDEAMLIHRHAVEGKIFAAALERFLRKIDADCQTARQAGDDRKGTGVSEAIQCPARCAAPNELSVLALVEKKTGRITGSEIERVTDVAFEDGPGNRQSRVPANEPC